MAKKVISEEMVRKAAKRGEKSIVVDERTIITPSARDAAKKFGIQFGPPSKTGSTTVSTETGVVKKIAFGSDHGGFALKEKLKTVAQSMGLEVIDKGTFSEQSVDYPDFAHAVAQAVASGACDRGVIINGAGIGSGITANKVPGIRAAVCWDISSAVNSREHNNANVLCLGSKLLGEAVADQILRVWIRLPFAGGRHANRINKITEIEKRYLK